MSHAQGWHRRVCGLVVVLAALLAIRVPAQAAPTAAAVPATPTVLYVATERLTDLVLGHRSLPHPARLGFAPADRPWHAWYGGAEVQALLHLPKPWPAGPLQPRAEQIIGNRFGGQSWPSGLAALASFDTDGNGVVEGEELRDLYVWFDLEASGQVAVRADALRPAAQHYHGFLVGQGSRLRQGPARAAQLSPFAVMVPFGSRIHLLDLPITGAHDSPLLARLALVHADAAVAGWTPEAGHPLHGQWRWSMTNSQAWADKTRPWGDEAGGQLILTVSQGQIRGVVKMLGPHNDRIQLPLTGHWREGRAEWRSVSPLGLTRSVAWLDERHGHPLLRGRSTTNRNGKVREWTWEARLEDPHLR